MRTISIQGVHPAVVIVKGRMADAIREVSKHTDTPIRYASETPVAVHCVVELAPDDLDTWFAASRERRPGALTWFQQAETPAEAEQIKHRMSTREAIN